MSLMKNIITASVVFYFKGEKFTPSLTLELDTHMQAGGSVPDLYPLIANENNIDLYSYEYEMMQAEPVRITHAEGMVAEHITDGVLNSETFEIAWHEQQRYTTIRHIMEKNGLNHILEQYPDMEQTLVEIYKAGEERH